MTEIAREAGDRLTEAIDAYLTARSDTLGESQALLGDWILAIEVQTDCTQENPLGDNAMMLIARPTTVLANARKLVRGAECLLSPESQGTEGVEG